MKTAQESSKSELSSPVFDHFKVWTLKTSERISAMYYLSNLLRNAINLFWCVLMHFNTMQRVLSHFIENFEVVKKKGEDSSDFDDSWTI